MSPGKDGNICNDENWAFHEAYITEMVEPKQQ